jgi:exodeoxyribonuclease VII small subunit
MAITAHDPQRTLERGYALVEDAEGAPLTTAQGARDARAVTLRFADGRPTRPSGPATPPARPPPASRPCSAPPETEMSDSTMDAAPPAPVAEPTYETATARIEEIIRRLDSGEAGLRETLDLCKEGRTLVEYCAGELDAVGRGSRSCASTSSSPGWAADPRPRSAPRSRSPATRRGRRRAAGRVRALERRRAPRARRPDRAGRRPDRRGARRPRALRARGRAVPPPGRRGRPAVRRSSRRARTSTAATSSRSGRGAPTGPPAGAEAGPALRACHEALRTLPRSTRRRRWPSCSARRSGSSTARGLERADRLLLRGHLLRASAEVLGAGLPVQALHGDAGPGNVLAGPVWNDWEDCCTGPVVWDLASTVAGPRVHGADRERAEAMLAAYGPFDGDLDTFVHARAAQVAAWAALAVSRGSSMPARLAARLDWLRRGDAPGRCRAVPTAAPQRRREAAQHARATPPPDPHPRRLRPPGRLRAGGRRRPTTTSPTPS